jgi:hypothetical protein
VIGAGFFGIHVTQSLSAAGFRAPDAESSQVADMMSKTFGQGDVQMDATLVRMLMVPACPDGSLARNVRDSRGGPCAARLADGRQAPGRQSPFVTGGCGKLTP